MEWATVTELISSVGFPIFVAVWMLYKSSKDAENTQNVLNSLRDAITELSALIKGKDSDDK